MLEIFKRIQIIINIIENSNYLHDFYILENWRLSTGDSREDFYNPAPQGRWLSRAPLAMLALMLTPGKASVIPSHWLELTLIPRDRSVAVCDLAPYAKCRRSCRLVCGHRGREEQTGELLPQLTGLIRPGVR